MKSWCRNCSNVTASLRNTVEAYPGAAERAEEERKGNHFQI